MNRCYRTILLATAAIAAPSVAQARMQQFDVPAQAAATGIPEFARQAGLQMLIPEALTRGVRTNAVKGTLETDAALRLLLDGSGLEVVSRAGTVLNLGRPGGGLVPAGHVGEAQAGSAPQAAEVLSDGGGAVADEIVVTGTALQNHEAIANRRRSLVVVDTLAQDDTGDFADQSLAEALSRVVGVSTMQVLYGEQESQYVAVRGITPDLNHVSVDGIGMISVANGGAGQRRVDLALIPSQAARRTDIYKTFTADQDSGAIGGIINIVPHSAYDTRDGNFYVDAFLSYATNNDVPGGNSLGDYDDSPWGGGVKALWSRSFGSDDQFGVVLSGTYQQRSYDDVKRNPNGRTYYTATGASTTPDSPDYNGFEPAPQAFVDYEFTSFIKTYGGSGLFEFRPTSAWYSSLMLYDYRQTEDQTNNVFTLRGFTGITNQTEFTGRLRVPDVRTSALYDRFENESRGAILKTRYDFDDTSNMEFRAGYNSNSFYDLEYANVYQYRPPSLFVDYDVSGASAAFALTGAEGLTDASRYALLSANDTLTKAKGESYEARLDFTRNFDSDSLGLGYKAGIGVRRADLNRNQTQTVYTSDRSSLAGYEYFEPDYIPWMWNYPVLWVDNEAFRQDVLPGLAVNGRSSANASLESDYRYRETISYAYLSALYAMDFTRIIGGLRMDTADYSADTPFAVGGTYQDRFSRSGGDYGYLLPSLNVVHDFSDRFRLKAGYSRTLGRPAPEDLAQAENRDDTNLTIARGNPDLKPRRSDNFDLAFERYFNGSQGMLSIGAFYKRIDDDIYELKQEQLIDGIVYTVSTPMNANRSTMRGLEFQYINNAIPELPGFLKDKVGVSLNVTRTWGDMDYIVDGEPLHVDRLLFQRNWMVNAAVFYQLPNDGEVRLGYNWGDEYYDGIGADPWLHRGPQGRGQMDMTIRYRIADDWIVKFQAVNLLGEDLFLGYGDALSMRRAEMKKGRTFFLNVIYKP